MSDTAQKRQAVFSSDDRSNLRWFWSNYLRKHMVKLLICLGLILVQGVIYQQFLSLTETGLRVIFEKQDIRDLILVCVVVFCLFALRGLLSLLVPFITVRVSNMAMYELRRDLIGHLMTLDLEYFERTKSGEILLKLVTQTQALGVFVGLAVANALRDGVTVLIVSGYLIYKNPLLFVSALVVLPFIAWVMNYVSDRVKTTQTQAEAELGKYMNGIEETVNGMRTVKINSQEAMEEGRLHKGADAIRKLMNRVQITQALVMPSIDLSSAVVYVLVIGGGGFMVLSPNYDIDGAGIITFLLGMVMVFDPARLLAQFFGALQANLVLLGQVRGLYDETPKITDAKSAKNKFNPAGDIILKDVDFAYDPDQPLFAGLNMTLKGGKTSAIVGSTGSGKTTILSLLSRLYDVNSGSVTIDGTPISKIKIAALRGAFSVVAQDIVIFNSSIWDNIRYVKQDATDDEIWRAAEAAELADVIRKRGNDPVGPKGAQLSGGQKQRISIARAFLRDAPILLLDEATSALDQATEERIKLAFKRLSKGRTTIIVAHRLSTVAQADKIFVLEAGQLVEAGKHQALLKRGGIYAQLYDAQKRGYNKT